jgi:NAD(P)-dependent dehydrogenase (short-subunit alcohol dehydrogenase family)
VEWYEAKGAVIIGGTSGMGLATAKMLLDEGARVLVTGRSQAGLEHFDKTFHTNARGTYFTVQKALPHLNDGASIILVASAGKEQRLSGPQHVQRHQGSAPVVRADVDQRTQGSED